MNFAGIEPRAGFEPATTRLQSRHAANCAISANFVLRTAALCMPLLPRQAGVEVRSLYKPLPAGLLFDYEVVKVRFFQKLGRWEGHHCVRATPQGVYFAAPIYEVVELPLPHPSALGCSFWRRGSAQTEEKINQRLRHWRIFYIRTATGYCVCPFCGISTAVHVLILQLIKIKCNRKQKTLI